MKRVVLGVPSWIDSDVNRYVAGVANGLKAEGFDARILVTQPRVSLERDQHEPVNGVEVDSLPRAPHDRLSDVWLALIRYLEEGAPSVYISNQDWVAALVCPRLSNRVQVIGILHEDTPPEYDHCARLGSFWNAIVVRDPALRQRIIGEYPEHAARLARTSSVSASTDPIALGAEYARLIDQASQMSASGVFRRRQRKIEKPPESLAPQLTNLEAKREASRVNAVPLWPDRPVPQAATVKLVSSKHLLRDHRIVLAVPTGRVSGVDVFSVNLARELVGQGYQAELVQTAREANVADPLPLPEDVPVFQLETRQYPTWRERWSAMRNHLESRGPCIYLPNYDNRHSCIIPTLSENVKVVGIGHSDDSQHYAHILHLAKYWDAVVGVSDAITSFISSLAPGIESRQYTIPYGVEVPLNLAKRRRDPSAPLRIVYTGRVVRFQKRALDLLSIAQVLQDRGINVELTVAGSGTELSEFVGAAGHLLMSRTMRYVGALKNEDVLRLLDDSDVFVLPSAFEGLPVSLLEAMAHGCVPVVTGIRSGVPEIINDEKNGFLVPIGGITEFADRLANLANDPCVIERVRGEAHATVKSRYGVDRMASAYIDVFEQIISMPFVRPKGNIAPPPSLQGIQAMMPRFPLTLRRAVWALRGNRS